jgi:hypothetical protein
MKIAGDSMLGEQALSALAQADDDLNCFASETESR